MTSLLLLPSVGEKRVIDGLLSVLEDAFSLNFPYQKRGLLQETTPNIESLIPNIIRVESSNNPNAVNKESGAKGLMQIMDDTAKDPGYGVKPLKDPFNPEENVRFGTEYLKAMMNKYNNNVVLSLAAFNMGPGKTDKWLKAGGDFDKLPNETQNYINRILN